MRTRKESGPSARTPRASLNPPHSVSRTCTDAGVFLEKLFKTIQLTLWLQSIQLSLFALPISIACMVVYDARAPVQAELFVGFGSWAWLTVALSALGGIAVSMALKYADNILKTFAVGCSIVLNCLISSIFLGVPLNLPMILGVLLVVGSTFLFNMREMRPSAATPPELRNAEQKSWAAAGSSIDEEVQPLTKSADASPDLSREEADASRLPPLEYISSQDECRSRGNSSPGTDRPPASAQQQAIVDALSAGTPSKPPSSGGSDRADRIR